MDISRPFTIALVELSDVFSSTPEVILKNPTIGTEYAGRRQVGSKFNSGTELMLDKMYESNDGVDTSVPLIGLKILHEMQL